MKKLKLFILFFGLSLSAISQTSIVLEKRGGVYYVPCEVNGLNMKFIFDTGASDVTISLTEALFMLKNGYLSENDLIGTNYYQIANGDIQKGTKILIKNIKIGGHQLTDIEASIIHNSNAPLLLGQSALKKLGQFSFDYLKNTLVIFDGRDNSFSYGCISGDCFNGVGTLNLSNNDVYIGDFKEGKYNGYGTYTYQSGEKYMGNFINSKRNGKGIFIYANGQKYVGDFKDDKKSGKGTLTFSSGQKYEGDFVDGKYNGYGILTFSKGQKYEGDFKDGIYNGYGILTYLNGEKYIGGFIDGKGNGNGTYIFQDGGKYVGGIKDGKYDGYGTFTESNGRVQVGYYKEGVFVGNK